MNKDTIFREIQRLSNEINEYILELNIPEIENDDYKGTRNREIIEIELKDNEKSVLLVGLNPSVTPGEEEDANINFLKWINITSEDKMFRKIKDKKYIHQRYYKPRYNLFKGYSMMWEKEEYINEYIKKYELQADMLDYLDKHKQNSSNFIIFADLIYFKSTDSNAIKKALKNEELSKMVFELFLKQIEYYNSTMVCFGYGDASTFIKSKFIEMGQKIENVYTKGSTEIDECYYNGVKYVFSTQGIAWLGGKMQGETLEAYQQSIYGYLKEQDMMPKEIEWNK